MVGSIVGAGLKAAGAIAGGIASAAAMKKVKKNLEEQRQKNEDWYNRRYNEDATQRADAQSILNQTQELLKQRGQQAAGSAAVMGSTEESVASMNAANNQAIANATSQIAAGADARKDKIEEKYMQNDNDIVNKLNDMEANRAQAITQAAQGVGDAASGFFNIGGN